MRQQVEQKPTEGGGRWRERIVSPDNLKSAIAPSPPADLKSAIDLSPPDDLKSAIALSPPDDLESALNRFCCLFLLSVFVFVVDVAVVVVVVVVVFVVVAVAVAVAVALAILLLVVVGVVGIVVVAWISMRKAHLRWANRCSDGPRRRIKAMSSTWLVLKHIAAVFSPKSQASE